jgi:hypothetical protein
MAAFITPPQFDLLPEIVDGWKEITLRFPTTPSMGGGFNPQWTFSATGELAGNRWEVLGAQAPALSGIPGNMFNLWPAPNQLGPATYGQMAGLGSTINMGWLSPQVTVTTDDTTADAVLIFGQDMPTITGVGVAASSQAVVGIGMDCGTNPCCIPSAIAYNTITWSVPNGILADRFTRTVSNGWGNLPAGQRWDNNGGAASAYNVNGTQATIALNAIGTRYNSAVLGAPVTDADMTFSFTPTFATSLSGVEVYAYLRYTDVSNTYLLRVNMGADNTVSARILRIVGGVTGFIGGQTAVPVLTVTGSPMMVRFQAQGFMFRAKVWDPALTDEPEDWLTTAFDNTSAFATGLSGVAAVSNSATGVTIAFDEYLVSPLWLVGSRYQLERSDTVETGWKVIMNATNMLTNSFKDYEARVGIQSSYRLRAFDAQDFPGAYSSTVSITTTAPGVTGGCVGQGHLLIFTSNSKQDGSVNLAYSSAWMDSRVEEDFSFPEAGFVQMQAMYNRDFFTAFHPTERGGEQFQRTVLVQAAAISPQSLADFTGLRDMAWSDVPYICVRDEDGNRWFTNVQVPQGRVLRDRRLYLATVNIVEVTDTPAQVDP